jgi:hypothetical protein
MAILQVEVFKIIQVVPSPLEGGVSLADVCRYLRQVDIRLPGKGNSNSQGSRLVY